MKQNTSYYHIWQLAYPIMIGSLAQNIISLTDTIFLGRVGEVEQGACGLISIYYLIMVMMGMGFSRGAQIIIARRAGQGENAEVGHITQNLLYIMVGMSVLMLFFLKFASPNVIWFFIKSPEIYKASLEFLEYRSYGIVFGLFSFVLMAFYIGTARTKPIAIATIVLCLVNVVANYCLVFGYYGFPKMGIAGSGLASTIAEIVASMVGLMILIIQYLGSKYLVKKQLQPTPLSNIITRFKLTEPAFAQYNLFSFKRFNTLIAKQLSVLAVPLVVQYLLGLGSWFLFFTLIEKMGEQPLAISIVLKMVYTFFSIPAWSFASAGNSLISNLIGQNKLNYVLRATNRTAVLSFICTLITCSFLIVFPQTILGLFTQNIEVLNGSKPVLFVVVGIILACSISAVIFNAIMGTGATLLSLGIETICVILYLLYAYIVAQMPSLHELNYIWAAEFMYWVLMALMSWWYLQSEKWRNLKM